MHRHSRIFSPRRTAWVLGLPLWRAFTRGAAQRKDLSYSPAQGDEVEDLYRLVCCVKSEIPDLGGVSSGAIASDYQRLRVENVCQRLGLVSLAFLWRQPQQALLEKMIDSGISAVLIKVAAMGLHPESHLGQPLTTMQQHLRGLHDSYGCNVCGEGGEYETLVLDCPLFMYGMIHIDASRVLRDHQAGDIAPSGVLDIQSFHIEPKLDLDASDLVDCIRAVPESFGDFVPPTVPPTMPAGNDDVVLSLSESESWLCIRATSDRTSNRVEACLEAILCSLKEALLLRGCTLSNAVFVHLFLRDMNDFAAANRVYCRYFPSLNPPSRACVQLDLERPCELHALVFSHSEMKVRRSVLHVQSISEWAPCCIGPYSQATSLNHLTLMAGQLGLDPVSMSLDCMEWEQEVLKALKHCQSIAIAVGADSRKSTLKATVFLSEAFISQFTQKDTDRLKALFEDHWPTARQKMTCREAAVSLESTEVEDVYLRPPAFDFEISPVVTYVVASALPRNARIEIQSILINDRSRLDGKVEETNSSVSSGGQGLIQRHEWHSPYLSRPIVYGVLDLGTEGLEVKPKAAMLHQSDGLCFIQIGVPVPTGSCFTMEGLGDACFNALRSCLGEAGRSLQDVTSAVLWYNADRLSERDLSQLRESLDGGRGRLFCLPTKGVGIDTSLSDLFLLDATVLDP